MQRSKVFTISIMTDNCNNTDNEAHLVMELPSELLDAGVRIKTQYDPTVPNSLEQMSGELIKSSQTRRPKKYIKKKIQDGVIDIEEFQVSFDKFPYIDRSKQIKLDDLKYITKQLGFIPVNFVEVAYAHPILSNENSYEYERSCGAAILKLYPLNHELHNGKSVISPFPTMFWCFCPDIHAKVSILEEDGYVQIFTNRLQKSANCVEYLEAMRSAHMRYAEERWNMLSDIDVEYVKQHGW